MKIYQFRYNASPEYMVSSTWSPPEALTYVAHSQIPQEILLWPEWVYPLPERKRRELAHLLQSRFNIFPSTNRKNCSGQTLFRKKDPGELKLLKLLFISFLFSMRGRILCMRTKIVPFTQWSLFPTNIFNLNPFFRRGNIRHEHTINMNSSLTLYAWSTLQLSVLTGFSLPVSMENISVESKELLDNVNLVPDL